MEISVKVRNPIRIQKTWGYEEWIHNDEEYCGKLLVFTKVKNRFSMHYHIQKKETCTFKKEDFNLIGLMLRLENWKVVFWKKARVF